MAQSESAIGKVTGCGLNGLGLHLKDSLSGELFTTPRGWLTLGGAVPPASARPQMSKQLEHRKLVTIVNIQPGCAQ